MANRHALFRQPQFLETELILSCEIPSVFCALKAAFVQISLFVPQKHIGSAFETMSQKDGKLLLISEDDIFEFWRGLKNILYTLLFLLSVETFNIHFEFSGETKVEPGRELAEGIC